MAAKTPHIFTVVFPWFFTQLHWASNKPPHASMRGSLLAFRQSSSRDVGTSATGGAGATAAGLRARACIDGAAGIDYAQPWEGASLSAGRGDSKMYLYICRIMGVYLHIVSYHSILSRLMSYHIISY